MIKYISAIKRDELLRHVVLVNLKIIMLSAGSLLQKKRLCNERFHLNKISENKLT